MKKLSFVLFFALMLTGIVGKAQNKIQYNWHFCSKCQVLFFGINAGVCPVGGTHEHPAGSADYGVYWGEKVFNAQNNWHVCGKCNGLFFGNNTGVCASGRTHEIKENSEMYFLCWGDNVKGMPNFQDKWNICSKCKQIYHGGGNPYGVCPANGKHVPIENSEEYKIKYK